MNAPCSFANTACEQIDDANDIPSFYVSHRPRTPKNASHDSFKPAYNVSRGSRRTSACLAGPDGLALQANEIALDAQIAATGVMMLAPVVPVAPVTLGRRSARIPQSAMASCVGLCATDILLMVAGRIRSFGPLLRSGPLFGAAATESRLATPSWEFLADDPAG